MYTSSKAKNLFSTLIRSNYGSSGNLGCAGGGSSTFSIGQRSNLSIDEILPCSTSFVHRTITSTNYQRQSRSLSSTPTSSPLKFKKGTILGIETSCDDTGIAIVNHERMVLGESLNSQLQTHLNHGGVIPPIAKHLHEKHISRVHKEALANAKMTIKDVDAVAVTVKPGLAASLSVGLKHAKELCIKADKPIIPIHHMEAHALTARLLTDLQFPFMVLLISGGHCLLAVAKGINDFLLLGKTIDDPIGEAFDKTARRLKLHNNSDLSCTSGGAAIEKYAKEGNAEAFQFPTPMYKYRDCNWSFAGLKFSALRHVLKEERKYDLAGSDTIPSIHDLCASFQHAATTHLCKKIHRGMIYADMRKLIPPSHRKFVVSGGVACNNYITRGIKLVCDEMNYEMFVPPNELCTDNGVMIAWNGVEKWTEGIGIYQPSDMEQIEVEPKTPFGIDLQQDIRNLDIRCKRINMKQLYSSSPPSSPSSLKPSFGKEGAAESHEEKSLIRG